MGKINDRTESFPLDFEVITRIPREQLVNIICDFYQDIGHKKIRIKIQNLSDKEDLKYNSYKPNFKPDTGYLVSRIDVFTNKRKNKQKFDIINFKFEDLKSNKTKIKAGFQVGFQFWHYIYFIIAFLIGLEYAGRPFTTGAESTLLTIALLIPLAIITYPYWFYRYSKIEKHPNTARYKKEFEEYIKQKEQELFPQQ